MMSSLHPLTADIRWTPDIGLTPPDRWIPGSLVFGEDLEASQNCAKISLLYLLETANMIREISPRDSHMIRYKEWIMSEASNIRQGHHDLFGKGKIWARAKSEERREKIRQLSSRWEDNNEYNGWHSCAIAILENCIDLMNGTQNSLDLLLHEKRLERLYTSAGGPARWSQVMKLMGLANPRMRILEIGGGTGAYTRKALEDLQSSEGVHLYSKYVFSDISPGFTDAAQEEFGSKRNVEFKVLDISQEVENQGFQPHSYDLVIASNVGLFIFHFPISIVY